MSGAGNYWAVRRAVQSGARAAARSTYSKAAMRKVLGSNVAFRASSSTITRRVVRAYYKSPMTRELVKIGAGVGAAYATAKAANYVFKAGRRVRRATKYQYYKRRVNKPGYKGARARRLAGANAPMRGRRPTQKQLAASRRNIKLAQKAAASNSRRKGRR